MLTIKRITKRAGEAETYFNITQAAHHLGICVSTLSKELKAGKIRHRRIERRVLIPKDALIDYANGKNAEQLETNN